MKATMKLEDLKIGHKYVYVPTKKVYTILDVGKLYIYLRDHSEGVVEKYNVCYVGDFRSCEDIDIFECSLCYSKIYLYTSPEGKETLCKVTDSNPKPPYDARLQEYKAKNTFDVNLWDLMDREFFAETAPLPDNNVLEDQFKVAFVLTGEYRKPKTEDYFLNCDLSATKKNTIPRGLRLCAFWWP